MLSAVGLSALGALAPVDGASAQVLLSEDQREWVDANPVVRYGISSVSYPFVFEDEGRPKGIVIDYLSRIEARTGLAFRYVPTRGKVEARRALEAGEIALVPFMRIDEARTATHAFTRPVARVALGLFTRAESPYVEAFDDLAGRRVGVPAGTAGAFGRVRSAPTYIEFESTGALDRMLRQERLDIAARYAQAPAGSGVVPTAAQAAIVTSAMAAAVAAVSIYRNGRATGR